MFLGLDTQTPYRKSFGPGRLRSFIEGFASQDCPIEFSLIFSFITILSQCRKDVYIVFDRIPL